VLAVVADKSLDAEHFSSMPMPDAHPTGGQLHVCAVQSRAGNEKLWEHWFGMMAQEMKADLDKMEELLLTEEYSHDGVITMDGEASQIKTVLIEKVNEDMQ
jgi:hypothetical protein